MKTFDRESHRETCLDPNAKVVAVLNLWNVELDPDLHSLHVEPEHIYFATASQSWALSLEPVNPMSPFAKGAVPTVNR
jgi:hypothetical protein